MPRLVIRVNDAKPLDSDDLQPRREIVEYRWDRIIPAALVLILFITAVAWLMVKWLSAPEPNEPAIADSAPVFKEEAASTPANIELPQIASGTGGDAATASPERPAVSAEAPQAEATAATPQPAPAKEPAQAKPAVAASASKPARVIIHARSIKQAQLTTNVIDEKPVDKLPAEVPMNEQGLLRIYLFTETAGLQDRKLYHHWYRNGKQMARVRVPTDRKPVIASSSKFINRQMTGSWSVKIIDDRDKVLATAKFEVHK